MSLKVRKVMEQVGRRIAPTRQEKQRIQTVFGEVQERILRRGKELAVAVWVEEVGSVGKDTWIRGEADLDAFIIFPKKTSRGDLEKYGLELGKYAARGRYLIAYAEHPYVRTKIGGLNVDIVPCIGVDDPSQIVTSVDRTPFHKKWVLEHVDAQLRRDVRLLKRYLKGIRVYGAEIRVRGFSGYLAELLVIHYGGFVETLEHAVDWREGEVLDPARHYRDSDNVRIVFEDNPLIVVDPVDRRRNVAAAVTKENMAVFVSSAREFLSNPSTVFFEGLRMRPKPHELKRRIREDNVPLVAIKTKCPRLVPDVLWGQLYKSLNGICTLLARHDFRLRHADVWTDEESSIVFLFELESLQLPSGEVRIGPSVYRGSDSMSFVRKHQDSSKLISGPGIRDDRWTVTLAREFTTVPELISLKIHESRLGSYVEKASQEELQVRLGEEVAGLSDHDSFQLFLEDFLKRRPIWLEQRSKRPAKNS